MSTPLPPPFPSPRPGPRGPFGPGGPGRPGAPLGPRPAPKPRHRRRWLIIALVVIVLLFGCGLCARFALGSIMFSSIIGSQFSGNAPAGQTPPPNATPITSAHVAGDFMDAMKAADYARAYGDLDQSLTLGLLQDAFIQDAQRADQCFGRITTYTAGTVVERSPTELDYTYSVTRAKLPHAFSLTLTLSQGANGAWAVSSYGDALLPPGNPTCKA
jgi:hypothetical protein